MTIVLPKCVSAVVLGTDRGDKHDFQRSLIDSHSILMYGLCPSMIGARNSSCAMRGSAVMADGGAQARDSVPSSVAPSSGKVVEPGSLGGARDVPQPQRNPTSWRSHRDIGKTADYVSITFSGAVVR